MRGVEDPRTAAAAHSHLVDVARRLEHRLRGQVGAVDVQHVLLQDEVPPPLVQDVRLQRAARRAQVVQTRDTAVDLKGGHVEHAPLHQLLELGPVELRAACCLLRQRRTCTERAIDEGIENGGAALASRSRPREPGEWAPARTDLRRRGILQLNLEPLQLLHCCSDGLLGPIAGNRTSMVNPFVHRPCHRRNGCRCGTRCFAPAEPRWPSAPVRGRPAA